MNENNQNIAHKKPVPSPAFRAVSLRASEREESCLCAKMSTKKKDLDSKKKRKRVVVESESGDDDSDEDLEEVCVFKMHYFAR